jgi:hypothetical protein
MAAFAGALAVGRFLRLARAVLFVAVGVLAVVTLAVFAVSVFSLVATITL